MKGPALIIFLLLLSGCVTEYIEEPPYSRSHGRTVRQPNYYNPEVLEIGMSQDDVNAKWGIPSQIVKSATESQTFEQWEYCNSYSPGSGICEEYKYLYFDNGKLTGWKE